MTVIAFDRRANHRIVSDVSVLDIANDVDALAQIGMSYIEPAHLRALSHGDREQTDELVRAHKAFADIRERVHEGIRLLDQSVHIDPYRAIEYGGGDAA